ncbi:MAG TPA: FKBP-type peptidyl-prolyl cis-trans isomerase, partial [Saprospiraceae bacterium]|nr:FKBP-type peptidyl-prolyl cis-trans isomerase [Saprospiraceae bacterium]
EIVIPGKAEDMSGTAVVEGLTMMHAGDSLIVYEPVEQVNDLPEVMKNWKEVNYRLKVVEVIKQSDLENVKRRESQVATLIQQDLQKYKNQQFERIIQTQSGLTILIHQDGEGEKFVEGDVARILFYAIETKEGKYFDGTFDTGVPFKLVVGSQRIIEGLGEAVSLLRRGAKVSAYIPSKLAYGSTGVFEKLEPDTDLLFYIEILN